MEPHHARRGAAGPVSRRARPRGGARGRAAVASLANQVRSEATRIYSRAWDDRARRAADRAAPTQHGRRRSAEPAAGRGFRAPERPRRLIRPARRRRTLRPCPPRRSATPSTAPPTRTTRSGRSARRSRTSGRTSPTWARRGGRASTPSRRLAATSPLPDALTAAVDRAIDEIGRIDGSASRHRLAVDVPAGRPPRRSVSDREVPGRGARTPGRSSTRGSRRTRWSPRAADAARRCDAGPAASSLGRS